MSVRVEGIPPDKAELFKKLWLEGASYKDIKNATGLNPKRFHLIARIMGLPLRGQPKISDEALAIVKKLWELGKSVDEIARTVGINDRTVRDYLQLLGLLPKMRHKCPEIPREELERLSCYEVMSDMEIAKMFETKYYCIQQLRLRSGIYTNTCREAARLEKVISALKANGFITTDQLRKMKAYMEMDKLVKKLAKVFGDNIGWFSLRQRATSRYTVFPYYLGSKGIIYLKGSERVVAEYLVSVMVKKPPPTISAAAYLLRKNGVPEEIVQIVREIMREKNIYYRIEDGSNYMKTRAAILE